MGKHDLRAGYSRHAALNEEQYLQVCEACDHVLLASDSTLETVAIPWLHVIREHPSFLKDYEDLFLDLGTTNLKKKWRFRLGQIRQLWKAFRSNGQAWLGKKAFHKPVDILLVSHLLNASQAGNKDDFYFGDLPLRLQQTGHSVVVALIDHTGNADESLLNRWNSNSVPHIVFSNSLDLRREWSFQKRLKGERARLNSCIKSLPLGLLRRVFSRASVEALSGGTITTIRMHHQMRELVKCVEPKILITTYEGHAWERMVFAAARNVVSSALCVGYQHAAIFRLQHGALRNLGREFNPDHLFANGLVSRQQIVAAPKLEGMPVTVLGSCRFGFAAHKITNSDTRLTCLVIPEGIASECNFLFEFSLNCALLLPNMTFIWRMHPIQSFHELAAKNKNLQQLPSNILISQASLNEDVAGARYALYRGSTAIVNAVCAGVHPIYLSRCSEMTIDPLHQIKSVRTTVMDSSEFLKFVQSEVESQSAAENQTELQRYCAKIYSKIDSSAISALLNYS